MSNPQLDDVRKQIDALDIKIQDLITQRAHLARQVAEAKFAEDKNAVIYRPEREAEVLRNVALRNQGPLPNNLLNLIFTEIMAGCRALQHPLSVAFLGPEGTYCHTAALKHFGHTVQEVSLQTIPSVFREIEADTANYGVVPIENSTEGSVNQTLDCFVGTSLKICGEIELPIHHHLLSLSHELQSITLVCGHQQALAQCSIWLDTHLPNVKRIAVNSNAEAAIKATHDSSIAAIAGKIAANIYQLNILNSRIENNVNNTTRFAVLGKQTAVPTGKDKTSLLLSGSNEPGALYAMLRVFAENQINMTRIESRPSKTSIWEYVFFIDIEGHIDDESLTRAMQALQSYTSFIKHLGSYPKTMLTNAC